MKKVILVFCAILLCITNVNDASASTTRLLDNYLVTGDDSDVIHLGDNEGGFWTPLDGLEEYTFVFDLPDLYDFSDYRLHITHWNAEPRLDDDPLYYQPVILNEQELGYLPERLSFGEDLFNIDRNLLFQSANVLTIRGYYSPSSLWDDFEFTNVYMTASLAPEPVSSLLFISGGILLALRAVCRLRRSAAACGHLPVRCVKS